MLSCLGLRGHHTPPDKHLELRPFQTSRNFTKQSEGNIQWAAGEQVCEVTCRPPCMKDDWGFVSVYRIFEKWSDFLENLGFKLNMYQFFVLHDLSIFPPQNICVGRTTRAPPPPGRCRTRELPGFWVSLHSILGVSRSSCFSSSGLCLVQTPQFNRLKWPGWTFTDTLGFWTLIIILTLHLSVVTFSIQI